MQTCCAEFQIHVFHLSPFLMFRNIHPYMCLCCSSENNLQLKIFIHQEFLIVPSSKIKAFSFIRSSFISLFYGMNYLDCNLILVFITFEIFKLCCSIERREEKRYSLPGFALVASHKFYWLMDRARKEIRM